MSLSFNNVGINLTETKIQVVEIINKGDKFFVENIDEEFFPEILNFEDREGKIIDILQASFNEILLRNKFQSTNVSITLPPKEFKVFQIPLEKRLSQQDKSKYLKWEFERLFPYASAENFILKYFTIKEDAEKNSHEICAFALREKILITLNKFFLRNNLILKRVDHANLATINVLKGSKSTNGTTSLNAYLGEKSLSLIFTKKFFPLFVKTIEFDSISEIPERLSSTMEATETFGLNKYDFMDGFIAGELISGSLLNQLKEKLDITLKKLNPFASLDMAEHLKSSPFFTEKYNSFASACGIALRLD